ncbi:MAG: hypothetical protein J6B33_00385 [Prevotella sp.]|nr:hypothetical protein [Prevotella sp.]
MSTIVLDIKDSTIIPSLKKILSRLDGVSIIPQKKKRKSGIELAREDVVNGRVTEYNSVEELFDKLGI